MVNKDIMGIELGDDLMRQAGLSQLKPEDTTMSSLKFDAKGSVHVMCRNGDDKLLKDLTVKDITPSSIIADDKYDYSEEIDKLRSHLKKVNSVIYVLMGVVIVLFVSTFVILKLMQGGL